MREHIVSPKIYYVIFISLAVLTVVTWSVAKLDLGKMNAVVALTIAVIKATLVVLYFMHVRYSSRLTWVFVCAGFFWLAIMVALTLGDYMTRGWLTIAQ
jgi:cytochrome c oxidase subunit IV